MQAALQLCLWKSTSRAQTARQRVTETEFVTDTATTIKKVTLSKNLQDPRLILSHKCFVHMSRTDQIWIETKCLRNSTHTLPTGAGWSSRRQLVPSFTNLLTLLFPMGLIPPHLREAHAFLPQPDCVQCARHVPSPPKHSSSAWHFGSLQHAKINRPSVGNFTTHRARTAFYFLHYITHLSISQVPLPSKQAFHFIKKD